MAISPFTGLFLVAIYMLLSKNRIVFVGTPIDDSIGNLIVAQLLYLAQNDPDHEIQVYINAPVVRWTPGWPSTTPCTWSSPRSQPRASGSVQDGAQAITSSTPAGLHLVEPSELAADGASFSVTRTSVPSPRRRA